MKNSISLDSTDSLYLCTWNGNEIKQIHTQNTLWNEYKHTNLFDNDSINISMFECFSNEILTDFKLSDYLKFSQSQDINGQDIFLNVKFVCDNMTITKIV